MKAIRVYNFGGPEVMKYEDISEPSISSDQALIELKVAGVNFIDVYFRTGLYGASLPLTLGLEGAGVVTVIGSEVKDVKVGDRVAYTGILGSYAQKAAVTAHRLVRLPDEISFKQGAACMVQGITAQYLATSTYPLKKSDICLIHAAAGGAGVLLCQMAKLRGAMVIGTVSNEEKVKLAMEAGADHVILYTKQDFVSEVKRLTDYRGVDVVYDGVGAATFEKS